MNQDEQDLNNNQSSIKNGRGGKRSGAGRPRGSTNKIKADEFRRRYLQRFGVDYLDDVLNNFEAANALLSSAAQTGNPQGIVEAISIRHKYDSMIAKYLWHDLQEIDITTQGKAITANFTFLQTELPDWKKPE